MRKLLETVGQDVHHGWRSIRRSPGYALVSCATLALGIGASIAMFTVLRSVLWRPLPYADPDRLVVLDADLPNLRGAGLSAREVAELRGRSRTLQQLAIVNGVDAHVEVDGEIERVAAISASADFLPALGAKPVAGRLFSEQDDAQVQSVIISHGLWARRFHSDTGVVGKWISVNNRPRQVVGVLPSGFDMFLPSSTAAQEGTQVWFPATLPVTSDYRGEGVIGRLAGSATLADARRELDELSAQFARERPATYQEAVKFRVARAGDALTERVDTGLRVLAIAVAFVLLVSCVNVANLTLARASGRARELAVRRALGAGRGRLVQQLLTESLLLSIAAGALGLLLGQWGVQLLDWLRPTHLPRQSQVGMDAAVAWFSVGVSLAAGVFFGIIPAFRASAGGADALRASRSEASPAGARRAQRALVVAEIALSIVPLVAAVLMLRSFVNLMHAPIGFNPDRIVTAWMPINMRQYSSVPARWRLHDEVLSRIRALPGVEDVSGGSPPPFHQLQFTTRYGRSGERMPSARATFQSIMPGYLRIIGTRVIAGREFTEDDIVNRRPVAIVDSRIASQLWPAGAVGQRLAIASDQRVTDLEVIGVTEAVRVRQVRDAGMPHLFLPYHQFAIETNLAIKTSLPPSSLEPQLRKVAQETGTGRALFDVWPMSAYRDRAVADTRFTMLVLGGFAIAALLLAAIGLYGTLAYLASQRAREFGVRVALGATGGQILRLVAREAVVLTGIGVGTGMAGALAAAHAIRGLLYGVSPIDTLTIVTVAATVGALAMAASLKPARSASAIDPTRALRAE